jgi:starch phosphorylase
VLGRALANNISNLRLDPDVEQFAKHHQLDPLQIVEQEPDAGLGNGGLGRLAACFLDSMATLGIAGMGYGLRYDYGIFRQTIRDGWQAEQPDDWLARPDPWEVPRPSEAVEVRLNCSFEIRGGALRVVEGRPSSLIGIPYDRPVVGYGGRTSTRFACGPPRRRMISTSRNSAAAISSVRWPNRSPPRRSRACCIPTITRRKAKV